jgi:hypothetical protein
MTLVDDFIEFGYLPREIPLLFNSSSLKSIISYPLVKHQISTGSIYTVPGPNKIRRNLSIPNPISQIPLYKSIDANWNDILSLYSKSKISISTPQKKDPRGRAVAPSFKFKEIPSKQLLDFPDCKYVLHADISRYYGNIYKHSIPWAIHGKLKSKKDRTPALFGNQIDTLLRNTQDQQTKGIPVGPDSSLVVSEIIGSSIDEILQNSRNINGYRYIDDYFFYFKSQEDAEDIRSFLQELLHEYELELNSSKTHIYELPMSTENRWVSDIRYFKLNDWSSFVSSDLISYFNMCFRLCVEFNGERVLKYAIDRLKRIRLDRKEWKLVENFILRSMLYEPFCIPGAVKITYAYYCYDSSFVDIVNVGNCIFNMIVEHGKSGNGFEVSWCLFLCKLLKIKIKEAVFRNISTKEDSVNSVIVMDLVDSSMVDGNLDISIWKSLVDVSKMGTKNWLFIYEAIYRNWFGSISFSTGDFYSSMIGKNVGMYNGNAVLDCSDVNVSYDDDPEHWRSQHGEDYEDDY